MVVFWWSEHPLGLRARALGSSFFGGLLVERAPVRSARARSSLGTAEEACATFAALGTTGARARVRLLFGVVGARVRAKTI